MTFRSFTPEPSGELGSQGSSQTSTPPTPAQTDEKTQRKDEARMRKEREKAARMESEERRKAEKEQERARIGAQKREAKERKEREKEEQRNKKEAEKREGENRKQLKKEEEAAKKAAEKDQKAEEKERKKGRKGKKPPQDIESDATPPIAGLVELEGAPVTIPTYENIEKYGSITYPVKEPFQFINIKSEEGVLHYKVFEPKLNTKEKEIIKKAANAYDVLVNVNSVLVNVEDKLQFLDDAFKDIVSIYDMKLSESEYRRVLYHIERDYVGYGKIDAMVKDRFIEDISCNGPDRPLYVYHRFFESMPTNVTFDEVELNSFVLRLAQLSGRHISILQPIRDAALPDGSRINMTLGKEVTKKGSTFTIRKFRSDPISPTEIILLRTGDAKIFAYLWLLVEYGRSFLISGGTAAGKTTLLNAISMLIKPENKIVSVEDTPEINLAHPNWIQAVTRVGFGESGSAVSGVSGISGIGPSSKSAGDITLFDLLIAALRQRPDFIIVGEVRGEEAYTLFQAMSVGHATMGTIHAASMPELLARVESMPMNVPRVMVGNLDLVIFLAAVRKGDEKVRRIREIVEILGLNPATKELITNPIFRWDPVKDSYEFNGRSFQIEKISASTGIPIENLDRELENRIRLLERMGREGIMNYREVTDVVRQYYLDREALLRTEKLTSLLARTPQAQMEWGSAP